jgi:hypothetical protein
VTPNNGGLIIMDAEPMTSIVTESNTSLDSEPELTLTSTPIVDEAPAVMESSPVLNLISEDPLAPTTTEIPETTVVEEPQVLDIEKNEETPLITIEETEIPVASTPLVTEELISEVQKQVEDSDETSPIGILRDSIEKLHHLEEQAKRVLEAKIHASEEFKAKINEYKALDKEVQKEEARIE